MRLTTAEKARLLELFALGVPSCPQRFLSDASAVSREWFCRLVRSWRAAGKVIVSALVKADPGP